MVDLSIVGAIGDLHRGTPWSRHQARRIAYESLIDGREGRYRHRRRSDLERSVWQRLLQVELHMRATGQSERSFRLEALVSTALSADRVTLENGRTIQWTSVWQLLDVLVRLQRTRPPVDSRSFVANFWLPPTRFRSTIAELPKMMDVSPGLPQHDQYPPCNGQAALFRDRVDVLEMDRHSRSPPGWACLPFPYRDSKAEPSLSVPKAEEMVQSEVDVEDRVSFESMYTAAVFGEDIEITEQSAFVANTMLALQGIPSSSFALDRTSGKIHFRPERLENHSAVLLRHCSCWVIDVAESIVRLESRLVSLSAKDSVISHWKRRVRDQICGYRIEMNLVQPHPTCVLDVLCGPIRAMAESFKRFVNIMLWCSKTSTGVDLLSFLFESCVQLEAQTSSVSRMVHHMFGECFSLYLRSLRLRLVPDDTIIVVDDNTEPLRFPAFMSEIASDVARSDKCLRNLRRAAPASQAFVDELRAAPSISMCRSSLELNVCQQQQQARLRELEAVRSRLQKAMNPPVQSPPKRYIPRRHDTDPAEAQRRALATAAKRRLFAELRTAHEESIASRKAAADLERRLDRQLIEDGQWKFDAKLALAKDELIEIFRRRGASYDRIDRLHQWRQQRQRARVLVGDSPTVDEHWSEFAATSFNDGEQGTFYDSGYDDVEDAGISAGRTGDSQNIDADVNYGGSGSGYATDEVTDGHDQAEHGIELDEATSTDSHEEGAAIGTVGDADRGQASDDRGKNATSLPQQFLALLPVSLLAGDARSEVAPSTRVVADHTPSEDLSLQLGVKFGLLPVLRERCALIDMVYVAWVLTPEPSGLGLPDHVRNLRLFCLQTAGNLFNEFTSDLLETYNVSGDPLRDNSAKFLNGLLQYHMRSANYSCDRLAFIDQDNGECRLTYDISGPICDVITQEALLGYSSIFKFLLLVRRMSHALRSVWQTRAPVNRRLILALHQCRHFLTTLQDYIDGDVLHRISHDFARRLSLASNVDEMRAAHDEFIEGMRRACFLTGPAARAAGIFSTISRLLDRLRVQIAANRPADDIIEQFQGAVDFLVRIQRQMATQNPLAHNTLLLRLDFNGFYSDARARRRAETL
ncbi:Gamma tubulin complex component C-terminal domain-containing protein [Plasmodiophora brassicae]